MAQLVMAAATPHNPLLWRSMVDPVPDDLRGVSDNFAMIGTALRDLQVDALVVVGTDHIRQFFSHNAPAFAIGYADSYHGVFENEVRTFGMPYVQIKGHPELAGVIGGIEQLPTAVDFATSAEWRLDHGFVLPLLYLMPELDLPVVPIHTNAALPPLPHPARFAALGRHIRDAVTAWDSNARVALLTSGHMATEIGGPRQFEGGGSPDPDFDDEAVGWMVRGDLDAAVAGCTYERVMAAGNVTYQYVNVVTALAAMDSRPADFGEATPSRYASSPFFFWKAV